MRIIIDIPEQFESDYKGDMFKDFFSRVLCDIQDGTLCGNYEKETAEMFLKAFDESKQLSDGFTDNLLDMGYTKGYRKAIDDFAEALILRLTDAIYAKDVGGMRNLINDVAEQLKGGGK